MTPADFASRVVAYSKATHASVTSWGRSRLRNASVGGVEGSLHLAFLAVDVEYDEPIPLHEAERFATHLGLKLIRETDHDHLQAKEGLN